MVLTPEEMEQLAPLLFTVVVDGLSADPLFLVKLLVDDNSQKFVATLLQQLKANVQATKDRLPQVFASQEQAYDTQITALDALATKLDKPAGVATLTP